MDFSDIPVETSARWYRFALLLKGSQGAAEAVLLKTCAELAPVLDGLRGEKSRQLLLIRGIRDRCLGSPEIGTTNSDRKDEPIIRVVAAMPEPVRSAIALFYAQLLSVSEMAAVLKLSLEELGEALASGRALLHEAGVVNADGDPRVSPAA